MKFREASAVRMRGRAAGELGEEDQNGCPTMKAGTPTHFKTQRLKRLLKVPAYQAVGILESLWQFVAANAWEGNLGRIPDEDILAAIEYEGDGPALIAALVSCEFIDLDDHCRYRIHDWYEHAPEYVRKRIDRKYGKPPADNSGHWPPSADNGALTKGIPRPEPSQDQASESCPETPAASSEPAAPPVLEFPIDGGKVKTWGLKRAKVDEWKEFFPNLDVLAECRKALIWCIDNPEKRKTASGMTRFLSRWLSRAQDSGKGVVNRGAPSRAAPTAGDISAQEDEKRRLRVEFLKAKGRNAHHDH